MRRFQFVDSTSNKFWEVHVKGKILNVTFGKIGTNGQSKPKDFATPEKAKAEMEKLIKEKTGKGYVEVGGKVVKAAKPTVGKKTSAGSMGKELSKAEKKAKAEKVLLMYVGGQWELARGILEAAQEEHWLFEELLKGCEIEYGNPTPSICIKEIFGEDAYDVAIREYPEFDRDPDDYIPFKSELAMLEVLAHLPKRVKKLQKLQEKLAIHVRVLTKYWKEVVKDIFDGVDYDPVNFSDSWITERDARIAKIEKECEARSKALNKAWREEEDLGKGIKLEMMLIPAGKFKMGSFEKEDGHGSDERQHEVTFTKHYYMGKFAVTQEQWEHVMANNPSDYKGPKLPVNNVSWDDCQEFIQKLNVVTKGGYRLPTEAEWEYACRAGTKTVYSFGDEISPLDANYRHSKVGGSENGGFAIGRYKPNEFGLYSMHGEVNEWCEDWYGDYPRGPLTDPKGPKTGEWRVSRGGNNFDLECGVRSSSRWMEDPSEESGGFRLARTI